MDLTSSSKGNADTGQRDSGHLAVSSRQCGAGHRAGTTPIHCDGTKGSRINNLFKLAIIAAEASSSIRREMDLVSG
jgi:hypothetical protein